jgi:fused signal recognition particle receptor
MGLFDKFKKALRKTRDAVAGGLLGVFRGPLDEDKLEEIEEALLTADVGVATTDAMVEALREAWKKREITNAEQARPFLVGKLAEHLAAGGNELRFAPEKPTVILVAGVNGSGKTTSIAKLAHYLTDQGKQVTLGAGDTFRAAAVEQLTIWSKRLGVDIVKQAQGADPAAVAFDAADAAVSRGSDVLIIDTAGRLHTQEHLMRELEKIRRVLGKRIPGAPHETLLVLDATTGQNALQQARLFHTAAPVTGIFLSKLDGTAAAAPCCRSATSCTSP